MTYLCICAEKCCFGENLPRLNMAIPKPAFDKIVTEPCTMGGSPIWNLQNVLSLYMKLSLLLFKSNDRKNAKYPYAWRSSQN